MDTDIGKLYGVGAVKKEAYARLGIHTVGELLSHYPRGYEDRGNVKLLSESDGVSKCAYLLTVATEPRSARIKGRMSLLKFRAYDDSGICEITFFNQEYLKNTFTPGTLFRFYGKADLKGKNYSLTSPVYEPVIEGAELPPLVSVYPLTEGLSQKQIAKDVRSALVLASAKELDDPLPEDIRRRLGLSPLAYAQRNIHMPESFSALAAAKKRLIFDEFFTFALGLSMTKKENEKHPAHPCLNVDVSKLTSTLPYSLTGAQRRVISEIASDMRKDVAMNRMVIGDVGSGKTVCAAAAMYIAVASGRQAALMAPTEILARQHHADLCALFEPLGIRCELLVGSLGASEKKRIHKALAEPDPKKRIEVVIGTQALLSEGVSFHSPGIVVADEQHRFGVGQRATLAEKNLLSHTLVMSATPIPRSLALAMYGDLDVSTLDEMPAGRQRVDTFVVDEGYRERLDGFIRKQIAEGGQVYIVCPAVEDGEEADLSMEDIDGDGNVLRRAPLRSAVRFSAELAEKFPDLSVEFLHGKMKSRDKDAVMQRFASGKTQILVSTTVIEVGVNVPNACLMIVENADRFGLSQLHQLRGRVGRGSRKSYCILVSDATEGNARERLNVMKSCYNGYEIAERDLEMRGPGDFLRGSGETSVRQSGGVKFKLAALCDDMGLMKTAFAEARALTDTDAELSAHPLLRERVSKMFSLEAGTIN
ncbi:MAG: ATP-dependent DNA helicase RecG [Clostridia bacterium]|nr:ATP-dependent DNA helicase RecG [Clostridia bacterium]